MKAIREPAVSGSFYPGHPIILKRDIEEYIRQADLEAIKGDIKGIISPHAGYMYSGPVAAYGYKAISDSVYDTVIIIAPSHRCYIEGASVMDKGGYRTPLGIVEIDKETAGAILKKDKIISNDLEPHRKEHSLEVQLPFLQVVLGEFKLVPIIMIGSDIETCEILSLLIYDVIKDSSKRFLVVGSTDLSHYYSYKNAVEMDSVVVRHIDNFDIQGLIKDLEKGRYEACGAAPMIATMILSKMLGADSSRVLRYANSGDVTGDKSAVVGYISGVFLKVSNRDS